MNRKANVLIDKDGHARLTDFGLAAIIRGEFSIFSAQDSGANTTTWAAPEILRGGSATKEGDVFTFSMVAIEVRTRGVSSGSFSTYLTLKRHTQDVPLSLSTSKPLYLTLWPGSVPDDRPCCVMTSYGRSSNGAGTKSRRNDQPLLNYSNPSGCRESFTFVPCGRCLPCASQVSQRTGSANDTAPIKDTINVDFDRRRGSGRHEDSDASRFAQERYAGRR